VNLFQRNKFEAGCAEGGLKKAAIFQDVFSIVPFGETEIENSLIAEEADASGTGAEAVDNPGEFRERAHLEDLNAVDVARGPRSSGAGVDAWLAHAALCR
jgi:hypothetical protein